MKRYFDTKCFTFSWDSELNESCILSHDKLRVWNVVTTKLRVSFLSRKKVVFLWGEKLSIQFPSIDNAQ